MSIIYSYPTSQPTVDDLLIGTDVGDDNATKSFTVQSLVSLINAEAGSGTVTDVTISTDAFISNQKTSQPGAPAITYTLGLSATGTPSATTFLRGDNQWVIPTVSAGIGVFSNSNTVTSDVSSFNFTGAGITLSSNAQGDVTLDVPGATNAVESIINGNGISVNSSTGDVIITNTGVTGLINGGGISISQDSNGLATLSVTGQAQGTVTSVTAGPGLSILSGTASINPQIGLDYTGTDTYITQPAAATPLEADFIPFHSVTGEVVKKVAFGEIQASTLALVNTSITASGLDAITNTYDKSQQGASPNDKTIGAPPAVQIVTLSAQEYTDLANETPSGIVSNFLYLTTAAAVTPNTVNFTVTDGITNTGACSYNINTTLNGSAFGGSNNSVTGAPGTAYTLQSTVSGFGSCSFSASTVQTINGTIPTTPSPASVTQTVSGTLTAPAPPGTSTASLASIDSTTSWSPGAASTPGDYTITSNTQTGTDGTTYQGTGFNLSANVSNPAEWNLSLSQSTYSPASGTFGSANNVVGTLIGSIVKNSYQVAWNITGSYGSYVLGTDYFISLNSNIPGASNTTSGSGLINYNTAANAAYMTVNITTRSGLSFTSGGTMSAQSPVTGSGVTLTIPLTGSISSSSGFVQMNENISASGPGASSVVGAYTYNTTPGYVAGTPKSGTVGTQATFGFGNSGQGFTYDTANYWVSSSSVNITSTPNPTYANPVAPVTANITVVTEQQHNYTSTIAGIGGSNAAPGTGGSACNYSATITVYTDSSASGGLSVGQTVYNSASSNTPYSTNASAWWKTGAPGGTQLVRFDSSGTVAAISSC